MNRIALLLAAATLASGCLASRRVESIGTYRGASWTEARTLNFVVVGNTREEQIVEVAKEFERFHEIYRSTIADPDRAEPIVPLTIFVLAKEADLAAFVPSAYEGRTNKLAGLCRSHAFANDIFVVAEQMEEARELVFHEYHHLYFDRISPWAPLWLREGIANIWSKPKIEGRSLELGRTGVLAPHGRVLHRGRIPLARLIEIDARSPEYSQRGKSDIFYAQSTYFTHLLLHGFEDGEARLAKFGELLESGLSQREALEQSWGSLESLTLQLDEYQKWWAKHRTITKTLPRDVPDADVSVAKIPRRRVTAIAARVLAMGSAKAPSARELAERAVQGSPQDPDALIALALVSRKGESARSKELIARAAALPDAGFLPHYLAATRGLWKDAEPGDPMEARRHLERAIELNPRFAPALGELAELDGTDAATAVRLATRAAALDPADPLSLLRAATALDRAGTRPEALAYAVSAARRARYAADARSSAAVCGDGTVRGFADEVYPACEDAVRRQPDELAYRLLRGYARERRGDTNGAQADYSHVLDRTRDPKAREGLEKRRADLAREEIAELEQPAAPAVQTTGGGPALAAEPRVALPAPPVRVLPAGPLALLVEGLGRTEADAVASASLEALRTAGMPVVDGGAVRSARRFLDATTFDAAAQEKLRRDVGAVRLVVVEVKTAGTTCFVAFRIVDPSGVTARFLESTPDKLAEDIRRRVVEIGGTTPPG